MKVRYSRLTVQRRGDKQTVAAIQNRSGYFVHIKPDASRHGKTKLIIRRKDKPTIELGGRAVASLRKVLEAA